LFSLAAQTANSIVIIDLK